MQAKSDANLVQGEQHNGVLILRFCVDRIHDPETSTAIRDAVISLAEEASATDIVVDLSQVQFISSVGLLALMSLRRHVKNSRIVLTGLKETVEDVLVTCRLVSSEKNPQGVFETAESLEEAVKKLGP